MIKFKKFFIWLFALTGTISSAWLIFGGWWSIGWLGSYGHDVRPYYAVMLIGVISLVFTYFLVKTFSKCNTLKDAFNMSEKLFSLLVFSFTFAYIISDLSTGRIFDLWLLFSQLETPFLILIFYILLLFINKKFKIPLLPGVASLSLLILHLTDGYNLLIYVPFAAILFFLAQLFFHGKQQDLR